MVEPHEETAAMKPIARRGRWRWLGWMAAIGLGGLILIGLLLPVRRCAREAARRSACHLNVKMIGQALHAYAEAHGNLPPACTFDADGRPLHSWRTLILPQLGAQALFDSIDLARPWDDPANAAARDRIPDVYRCRSGTAAANMTTYVAVVSPEGCFRPDAPLSLDDLRAADGGTIVVAEVPSARAVPWMAPADIDAEAFLRLGTAAGDAADHGGGFATTLFADGAVRSLALFGADPLPLEWRRALLTTAADDPPGE